MHWVYLFIAGLFEVGFAVGLKYSKGFDRPLPVALTALSMIGSVLLLGKAAETIAIGTAYAIWVGIGAIGTLALGVLLFDETLSALRLGFALMLVVAVMGLKATAPD